MSDHALGHGFTSQKLKRSAFLAAARHAFYAEAARGRKTGDIREDLTGDADISALITNIHHGERLLSFI